MSKDKLLTILGTVGIVSIIFIPFLYIAYRLGYCDGCDKYIDASECKPKKYINFLGE